MKALKLMIFLLLLMVQPLTAWSFNLSPQKLPFLIPDASFTSQSNRHSLAEYKGHKVMLWLFSTWCHTCVAGVKAMQKKQAVWKKTGMVIIALRNFNNGGYPGVDMPTFMQRFAPRLKNLDNWITGEASKRMNQDLNQKKFPDIYFLIDEKGWVRAVNTAPNISMNLILKFASGTSQ